MEAISDKDIRAIMGQAWGINPDEIPSDAGFNDIVQWDSIGHVNLLVALEKEYNIRIDYETLTKLVSIQAIIECLKDKVNAG